MAANKIARKDSRFRVISILPDFCFVPGLAAPVPFPLFADLGGAVKVAKDVLINGRPAFVYNASKAPKTYGDEPGQRKGVISRTVGEAAWPMQHSASVKIRSHYIIRTGDMFHMNGNFNKPLKKNTCLSCKAALAAGRPVNPVLGLKFLEGETDFAFDGLMPLIWQRSYYSDQEGTGWLGQGWSIPGSERIERTAEGLVYTDVQGREFPLPEVEEDDEEPVLFESEQIWFSKNSDGHYLIVSLDGSLTLRFAPLSVSADDPSGESGRHYPLVAAEDANGNHRRILYHHRSGLPQYVIDGNGRVFYLRFANTADAASPQMRLVAVYLLAEGLPDFFGGTPRTGKALVRYEYSVGGDLIRVIGRDGGEVRRFGYRNHIMTEHTDAAGLASYYEYDRYDTGGRVIRNRTSLGEEWRFAYRDGYTEVTDVLGRTEQYHYDCHNELTARVFADGSRINMERDHLGRLTAHTDALGRTTRFGYSSEGQLESIIRPDGSELNYDYDDGYRLSSRTDAEGNCHSYGYDERGNLISHTDPKRYITRYRYRADGLPECIELPEGGSTEYRYDADCRLESITDCSGNQTRLSYTAEGWLSHFTDALGQRTEYHYDGNGRLSHIHHPDGGSEYYRYDSAGRLIGHTDAAGCSTTYEYRPDGQPLKRIDALGRSFNYRYDPAGRLTSLTNENGAVYRLRYDALDRLAAETGFDGNLTVYHYNAAGELSARDEYGNSITAHDLESLSDGLKDKPPLIRTEYRRDELGRLQYLCAGRHEGGEVRRAYHYDGDGRLVRAATPEHVNYFEYDCNGRLVGEHGRDHPDAAECREQALPELDWQSREHDHLLVLHTELVSHHYDGNGNRTTTDLPDGRRISRHYYGSGHQHGLMFGGETVSDCERDALHREIRRTQGRLTARYRYDPAGRLKEQRAVLAHTAADGRKVSAHAVRRSYHYDKDGNLVRSDDQRSGSTQYRYDALGQTVSAAGRSYAYDPAHNILDHIEADGAAAAAVAEIIGRPANDNRVRHHNGHSYYYDDFGNVIQKEKADGEVHNYHYDPLHQLVQADIFRPGREKESWTYQYDAVGRRIRKRRIDAEGGILGETRYLWSGGRLLQTIDGWQTHTYLYAGQDGYEPLAQVRNWTDAGHGSHESIHYFHCDQIGRPRELTDAEGRLLWYGEYDALGRLEREEDICGVSQPFRLQNQHYDEETGLHYNLLRYYDADMGRFLTQDPIGLSGGENAYTYAPNVQMWIDPLGLNPALVLGGYELWMLLFGGAVVVAGQQAAQSGGTTRSGAADVVDVCVGKCGEENKRKKCMEATAENIKKVTAKTPYFTTQRNVSIPRVARYTALIEAGSPTPEIKMDGMLIVDGNHRMVANLLCRQPAPTTPWTSSPAAPRLPFNQINPLSTDY